MPIVEDSDALIKLDNKLQRMKSACGTIEKNTSARSTRDAWIDLVLASGAFFSCLDQATKRNNIASAWFGRKKAQRRSDPLLRYLKFARNAEEHGIRPIAHITNSHIKLASPYASATFQSNGVDTWTVTETKGLVIFPYDVVRLVTVYDERFNDKCDPPTSHLELPVNGVRPVDVAQKAVAYFENLFSEAAF